MAVPAEAVGLHLEDEVTPYGHFHEGPTRGHMSSTTSNFQNTGSVVQSNSIQGGVHLKQHVTVLPKPELKPIRSKNINPDPNFTGRWSELKSLREHSERHPNIVVVCGLGGIGKTQLVRKYADNEIKRYQNVIWVNSKNCESVKNAFELLAENDFNLTLCRKDGGRKEFDAVLEEVLTRLCELPTLIVLDNVDEEKTQQFVLEFVLIIGTSSCRPHYVVTSRIKTWNPRSMGVIQLGVLNDTDAVELVSKTLIDDENLHDDSPENIKNLVQTMQNFPLTLRQSTAHINDQRIERKFSISEYIDEFNSYRQECLDSRYFKDEIFHQYKETTYTTWKVTIAAIENCGLEGKLALQILRIIAYFDSEYIRRDIFFNLTHTDNSDQISKRNVIAAVRILVKYCMIEGRENQSILSIHRLVQQVTKIDVENVVDLSKTVLRSGWTILWEMKKPKDIRETLDHRISVLVSAIKLNFVELVKERWIFPIVILMGIILDGKYYRVKVFEDEVIHGIAAILGHDHRCTLPCEYLIAFLQRELGKHDEARQLLLEVYGKQIKSLGEKHPDTVETMSGIAISRLQQGKQNEAFQMFRDFYEKTKNYGEDSSQILASKMTIANILCTHRKHNEALQIYQAVYDKFVNILGENHQSSIGSKFFIAQTLRELGKHAEALQMFQEINAKQVNILGEDHQQTMWSRSAIAITFHYLGKHTEAFEIFKEIYEKQIIIFGEYDPRTIQSLYHIAKSFRESGKHSEALQNYQEVFEKQKKIFGICHPDTIKSESCIAISQAELGNYTEALQMLQEVYEKRKEWFGEYQLDTIMSKILIAALLRKMGKYAEALEIFQYVYKKCLTKFGEGMHATILGKEAISKLLNVHS